MFRFDVYKNIVKSKLSLFKFKNEFNSNKSEMSLVQMKLDSSLGVELS